MIALGLIGSPVSHSRSPELHHAALTAIGQDGAYSLHDVPSGDVHTAVRALWSRGFTGLNVTLPHKVEAISSCDEVSALARRVGAVNTLHRRSDGNVWGTNTDVIGAMGALRARGVDCRGAVALVLGAGGAARGAVVGLLDAGVDRLVLCNRTLARARSIADDMNDPRLVVCPLEREALAVWRPDVVINATSLGLGEAPGVDGPGQRMFRSLPFEAWQAPFGYDLIYSKVVSPEFGPWTPFLQAVYEAGGETLDGWDMLVRQAAAAFAVWTATDEAAAYDAMCVVSR